MNNKFYPDSFYTRILLSSELSVIHEITIVRHVLLSIFHMTGLWCGTAIAITISGIVYFIILNSNLNWSKLSEEVNNVFFFWTLFFLSGQENKVWSQTSYNFFGHRA